MNQQKNIALVVQRYGKEIHGGAETHCRLLAQQLSKQYSITILTTVAKEYSNWQPYFEEGLTMEDNIKVYRFNNQPKGSKAALRYIRHKITNRLWYHYLAKAIGLNGWLRKTCSWYNPSQKDHTAWLEAQGPACPDLLGYIQANKKTYDVFIFFSHLYYPTALGIQLVKEKSILIPTVHDEKASYYPVYKTVMQAPAWIVYNSSAEKATAEKIYSVQHKNNSIVGVGIELPSLKVETSVLTKYKITGPYLVFIGRIEEGKGCKELSSFFTAYKKKHPGKLQLVMIGKSYMHIKEEADIVYTGFVDEMDKLQLLLQSTLLIVPSKFESLSMVLLEAMYYKKPVLVNEQCEVLHQHIIHSKGGLSYSGPDDFNAKLYTLLNNPSQLAEMGGRGYHYVHDNYSWRAVLNKFNRIIADLTDKS